MPGHEEPPEEFPPRRLSKHGQRAMSSAIAHSVKFQQLLQTKMAIMEEQLMESFTTALSELVPMQDDADHSHDSNRSFCTSECNLPEVSHENPLGTKGSLVLSPHTTYSCKPNKFREHPKDGAGHAGVGDGANGVAGPSGGAGVGTSALHSGVSLGSSDADPRQGSKSSFTRRIREASGALPKSRSMQNIPDVAGWILERQRTQGAISESIWRFIEDPESSVLAHIYDRLNIPLICLSVIISLMQSVEGSPLQGDGVVITEIVIDFLFLVEWIVRFIVIPNRKEFFLDAYNFIDGLSGLVLVIRLLGYCKVLEDAEWIPIVLFCYVPILRLLKVLRRYRQFHLLLQAFKLAFEALPVLLFCYVVSLLTFAALIYTFEREDDNIGSLSQAMWLSVVTMTTVGYGDVVPKTPIGKVVTGVLTVANSLYMAVPLGIIGNCFHQVWSNRDRLLLMQTLKVRLRQWGYSASDIPKLFEDFDMDGDGLLDFEEFNRMVQKLKLGLSADRTVRLFDVFDEDHGGSIDDKGAWRNSCARRSRPPTTTSTTEARNTSR